MRKFFLIGLLVGLSVVGFAQKQIKQYEYWFDNNYTAKTVGVVQPGATFNLKASLPTAGLSVGLHAFQLRFQDNSGMWSTLSPQFFIRQPLDADHGIVKYEYWFDNNYAAKKGESFTSKDTVSLVRSIATTSLPVGLHSFQLRFQDKQGLWSQAATQFFIRQPLDADHGIVKYEYWFDNNYAAKKGESFTSKDTVSLVRSIATTSLPVGLHSFQLRFQDKQGLWSQSGTQFFIRQPLDAEHSIVKYEYWFDNNYAAKKDESFTSKDTVLLISSIATTSLPVGLHSFQLRFQDKQGLWSQAATQFFIRQPLDAEHSIVKYEYWFDDDQVNKKTTTLTGDSVSLATSVSTGNLNAGLHYFQIRFQDEQGQWTQLTRQLFVKTPRETDHKLVKYEYWFDNDFAHKKSETLAATDSILLVTSLATDKLASGIHTFQIRFQDNTGLWSVTDAQFFIKPAVSLPVNWNKITAYRYWFDKDFSKQTTVVVDPVNPLMLENLLIKVSAPTKVNPDNYEFSPNTVSGHKVTYQGQSLFNIQFKDKAAQWSVVNMETVLTPYTSIVKCEPLLSKVPKVKNVPKADTIHFYMVKVIAGDSLIFQSDKSLIIDLYDPTGKKIKTISKQESTTAYGFHAQLKGEYYALVHGFESGSTGTYTLNYSFVPNYCVISYDRKVFGNKAAGKIVFTGNGFDNKTNVFLFYKGTTLTSTALLCKNYSTLEASFNFLNAPVGLYNINVNFGDTTIVITEGLEVNDQSYTVLSGTVVMDSKGNYPFAGVYEYDNLELADGATLLSYGISELVINVKGTLTVGKDVTIRVRNGYYSYAPSHSIRNVTKENIKNFASYKGVGYSLYPSTFGQGGNGGKGGDGGYGSWDARETDFNYISYFPGYGGGGGGGGAGGFGGGMGGAGGSAGGHSETDKTGIGKDGQPGLKGKDNGEIGGGGGAGGLSSGNTAGGTNGSATTLGSYGESKNRNWAFGGGGGGGNGGRGGDGDGSIFGNSFSSSNGDGGGGGGGGGYGGGILVISANEIITDASSKPKFLALGQVGGAGGSAGSSDVSGITNANSGNNGDDGEPGLVIINTPNKIPAFESSAWYYGANYPAEIGGHGLVTGGANVLYNVDEIPVPASAGTISGRQTICKVQTTETYTVPAIANAVSYKWTLPSGATGTSTTNSITVNYGTSAISGNITVRGKNTYGYGVASSLIITIGSKPATPFITRIGNDLVSDAVIGNQWYVQNSFINGAINQNYSPSSNGAYYVVVTQEGCSSDPSNTIVFSLTKIKSIDFEKAIKLYPNPVTDELTIENVGNRENSGFEIINSVGQVVFKGDLHEKTIVQTTNFLSGVYMLKLEVGEFFVLRKFIKK
jgi:hypothetical protein